MLVDSQVRYLASLADLKVNEYNGSVISCQRPNTSVAISDDYENFKKNMGLGDIEWGGFLGSNNMIAGGCALNWVMGEHKNNDIDFFFTDVDSYKTFSSFITTPSFNFQHIGNTMYAQTYYNEYKNVSIQLVQLYCGKPHEIMTWFDIELCKWAVTSDIVYTTTGAIASLLSMKITGSKPTKDRMFKYMYKGFYLSDALKGKL